LNPLRCEGDINKKEVQDDKTITEGITNSLLKFQFLEIEKYRVWKVLSQFKFFMVLECYDSPPIVMMFTFSFINGTNHKNHRIPR
jgi:hypothetical protein